MASKEEQGRLPLLLTRSQLKEWLQVSEMWVKMRLSDDPEFVSRCVIDIATPGSSRRSLRFPAYVVADYLGIPMPQEEAGTDDEDEADGG